MIFMDELEDIHADRTIYVFPTIETASEGLDPVKLVILSKYENSSRRN